MGTSQQSFEVGTSHSHPATPFDHLVPAWEALTPDQRRPVSGSSIPAGGPLETLDADGIEALLSEVEMFDAARRSASINLGRIIVA